MTRGNFTVIVLSVDYLKEYDKKNTGLMEPIITPTLRIAPSYSDQIFYQLSISSIYLYENKTPPYATREVDNPTFRRFAIIYELINGSKLSKYCHTCYLCQIQDQVS